jgi:hypothetical protein
VATGSGSPQGLRYESDHLFAKEQEEGAFMTRVLSLMVAGVAALAVTACQFSPTAPFGGFDNRGSRIVGNFASEGGGSTGSTAGAAAAAPGVAGIEVLVEERPSLKVTVDQNGSFTLSGLPSGSFTLVFLRDGQEIGEIDFKYVRKNQGIRITVILTAGDEVVLTEEERDQVTFEGECPRGAGFWCQNQGGKNPNLTAAEFDEFAAEAAARLAGVTSLDTADEVAAAVCNTGDQFRRQLATLALNIAAGTVDMGTSLQGEQGYATVGDVFNAALSDLTGATPLGSSDREKLKDVMERINNAQNVSGCEDQLPDEEEPEEEEEGPEDPTPTAGKVTICHIPPGNYDKRHTITIGASAWPSHQGHCAQGVCDYQGSCR